MAKAALRATGSPRRGNRKKTVASPPHDDIDGASFFFWLTWLACIQIYTRHMHTRTHAHYSVEVDREWEVAMYEAFCLLAVQLLAPAMYIITVELAFAGPNKALLQFRAP